MHVDQLTESAILSHLLLASATIYFTVYVPIRDQYIKRKKVYLESEGIMVGLYYHLKTGTDLFICKDWLPERITDVIKALKQRSPKVSCMIDFNAFKTSCGEEFDPSKLYTKPISKEASIYPIYLYNAILWSNPE
ncbi:hypothetical protein [Fibrella aestuarina]|uniref:hypothetical protein n=1 Tax=Fibrella aestuarina TaxID=651143 RepID=UPI00059D351F|nr:hypothetical protein [Fibrella aestuarina]